MHFWEKVGNQVGRICSRGILWPESLDRCFGNVNRAAELAASIGLICVP